MRALASLVERCAKAAGAKIVDSDDERLTPGVNGTGTRSGKARCVRRFSNYLARRSSPDAVEGHRCRWCSTASPDPHNLGAGIPAPSARGDRARDHAVGVNATVRRPAARPRHALRWSPTPRRTLNELKERDIVVIGT